MIMVKKQAKAKALTSQVRMSLTLRVREVRNTCQQRKLRLSVIEMAASTTYNLLTKNVARRPRLRREASDHPINCCKRRRIKKAHPSPKDRQDQDQLNRRCHPLASVMQEIPQICPQLHSRNVAAPGQKESPIRLKTLQAQRANLAIEANLRLKRSIARCQFRLRRIERSICRARL